MEPGQNVEKPRIVSNVDWMYALVQKKLNSTEAQKDDLRRRLLLNISLEKAAIEEYGFNMLFILTKNSDE